jgi:hypothetical protein
VPVLLLFLHAAVRAFDRLEKTRGKRNMKVAPRLLLALLATLGASGCRTAGIGSMARTQLPEPRLAFALDEFVADHNRNAQQVTSLEAKPSITVTMVDQNGLSRSGQLDGRLALERPRNFKLELSHFKSTVADIGSNDERFWFWVQNKKDKSIYYCDYAELPSTSLAVTYQPDWIVEALGLKPITPDEAAGVKVRAGTEAGTTALVLPASRTSGQTYSRVMIVSGLTRRIKEYRIYAGDGKTMIAQAAIKKYFSVPLDPSSEGAETNQEACYLPESIVLEWKREQLSLDVVLRDLKVNQFNAARRTALFVEPKPSGYNPVNLADVKWSRGPEGPTSVRETLPVPEPRSRVRLAPPLQIREDDSASVEPRRRDQVQRNPHSPTLLPILEEMVGAPIPTAPSSEAERMVNSAWSPIGSMAMER